MTAGVWAVTQATGPLLLGVFGVVMLATAGIIAWWQRRTPGRTVPSRSAEGQRKAPPLASRAVPLPPFSSTSGLNKQLLRNRLLRELVKGEQLRARVPETGTHSVMMTYAAFGDVTTDQDVKEWVHRVQLLLSGVPRLLARFDMEPPTPTRISENPLRALLSFRLARLEDVIEQLCH